MALTGAHHALVTTPEGTELNLDLSGRAGDVDVGLITAPGRLDNLPGGEAFIAPMLGIGTNPKAQSIESLLGAEKIEGTVHIAIGDNAHIGGVVHADLHMDFVLWAPDLTLDGETIIRRGSWVFEAAV